MTEYEQIVAIADHAGYDIEDFRMEEGDINIAALPSYLTDLNAMHHAEKYLRDVEWVDYRHLLGIIVTQDDKVEGKFVIWNRRELHATAKQKAEAYLKTIRRWRENNECRIQSR